MANLEQFAEEASELDQLKAANRRLMSKVSKQKTDGEELVQAVYLAAKDAFVIIGAPEKTQYLSAAHGSSGNAEVALIHATDWQLGKRTESYNTQVAEQRIARLGDKIEEITGIQRSHHPVNSAVVMFGGDMLEGLNIFPGQSYEVDSHLYEQLFNVSRLEATLVKRLLALFDEVDVYAEPGNHGRIGRTGDWPKADNMDRISYGIAQLHLQNEDRLTWHPYHSFYQPVTIGNYKAMLIHGDEIKSFGGNTPAYGLLRKGTAWSSGVIDEGFQDIYFGHYHTHMTLTLPNGGQMYGTGSTESDNEYAAEFVAAKGHPSQRLHFIVPEKAHVSAEYRILLGDDD